ncbi:MAG: T9SS type A sorting domain-containing protein [Bacteroidota bacterium]
MKSKYAWRLLLPAILLLMSATLSAQTIPNAGFESWTNGNPDNWFTYNIPQLSLVVITQSSDARSGSSAVRGDVIVYGTEQDTVPPILILGSTTAGAPISVRPSTLKGWYKFKNGGGDELAIFCFVQKDSMPIGSGELTITQDAAAYTQFEVPIEYFGEGTPDVVNILVVIDSGEKDNAHPDSWFLLDDLSMTTGPTSIAGNEEVPSHPWLGQNYPNPFNPGTTIGFGVPVESFVRIMIYDILGRHLVTLVEGEFAPGSYRKYWNASGLPSGVYVYRMEAGSFRESRKVFLLK